MNNIHNYLIEWIVEFLKNKDLMMKNILEIKKEADGFDVAVKFKDKEVFYLVRPIVTDFEEVLAKVAAKGNVTLVVLNNEQNLKVLIENWQKIADARLFCMIFVNPFSETDKRWIIYPYTHHRICDPGSLKTGLKSMFEAVERIDEAAASGKI